MTDTDALALIVHLSDSFRWWAVPGALLALIVVVPIVWKHARLLIARWLEQRGQTRAARVVAVPGELGDSKIDDTWRMGALIVALMFPLGVLVAGLTIPLRRSGWVDAQMIAWLDFTGFAWMGVEAAWRVPVGFSWVLWSSGCWLLVLSYAPNKREIVGAAVVLWVAAFYATHGMPVR